MGSVTHSGRLLNSSVKSYNNGVVKAFDVYVLGQAGLLKRTQFAIGCLSPLLQGNLLSHSCHARVTS